jgi:hypothetical protein
MDTTKEYIEMLKKATEIQELWVPAKGDIALVEDKIRIFKGISSVKRYIFDYKEFNDPFFDSRTIAVDYLSTCVWIPRQDQLQEMVLDNWDIGSLISAFNDFCHNKNDMGFGYPKPTCNYFKSYEQLWLAFVMKELFNKTWTGTDWTEDK